MLRRLPKLLTFPVNPVLEESAEDYVDELVDGSGFPTYVDSIGSVSALELERSLFDCVSDVLLENQYRRFLNGS